VLHGVPVYSLAYAGTKLYCLVTETMRADNLPNVALDSAAAGIEPAISNRKSNALTTVRHLATREVDTAVLLSRRCCDLMTGTEHPFVCRNQNAVAHQSCVWGDAVASESVTQPSTRPGSVTMTTAVGTNDATTLSRVNSSGYVGHETIFG